MTSLLLIERGGDFREELARRYTITSVTSGKQALTYSAAQFDAIVLDSASLRTPGERIARQLRQAFAKVPLIHISASPIRDEASHPADVVLTTATITVRKLHNAIARVTTHPDAAPQMIPCGTFAVDLKRRVLLVKGEELPLTPKLARLLEVFIHNPGATLERRMLMESVWQTDYLGDTRTLDVHVRWIRRAIEHDPSSPQVLLTVRGVGYRFEMPTSA